MRPLNNKSGSILLYTLLVISLITAIAITVSIIVVNEIRLTSGAANATMAYYAAESGIERGLYTLKIMRNDGTSTLTDAVDEISSFPKPGEASFDNNADYLNEPTSSKTPEIIDEEVIENDYIQADYYNVDNPLTDSGVAQIVVSNGPDAPEANPNPATWAEVSWTAWSSNGTLGTSTSARKLIGPTDLQPDPPTDTGWPIVLDVFSSQQDSIVPVGYRVRIKALFGDLSTLSVIPYDNAGSQVADLPSQLEIKSVGERGKFKQSLTATVPWKIPLHGLYDYVIFSEGDILKTIILSRQAYSSGVIQVEASNITDGQCSDCLGVVGDCQNLGWLATSCSVTATCDITTGDISYCSLPINNGTYTLPLPTMVPAGQEYYVSLRTESSNNGGTVEVVIDDPEEGELGLTYSYPNNSLGWSTCTIPESFALGTNTDRYIKFTNQDANDVLKVDWYQVSSYKIFSDCE